MAAQFQVDRVCVFGAGAVGGHLAARLARSHKAEVAVIARGPQLAAIRKSGVRLVGDNEDFTARPDQATDDPASLPPQDLVLVALKAHQLPAAARAIAGLLATRGIAVFLVNGLPWWWPHGDRVLANAPPPALLDPGGSLSREVRAERTLGAVVRSANEITAPGVIRNRGASRFLLGEPDGSASGRLGDVHAFLLGAGIPSEPTNDLRREVWLKLFVNASGNTVSALTRLDTTTRLEVPGVRDVLIRLTGESMAVAAAMGFDLHGEVDPAALVDGSRPHLRPSTLQDVLAGRTLEIDPLLGQLQLYARQFDVPTPTIDTVLALLRGLERSIIDGP